MSSFQAQPDISGVRCMRSRDSIASNAYCHDLTVCLWAVMCLSVCFLGLCTGPVKLRCLHWWLHFCPTDADVTDDYLWAFCCTAETERQGTDHLDLAGLPQRSSNSDSTHTLSTTPDSKKKSKGIKKLFGKWVETWTLVIEMCIWIFGIIMGTIFILVWISFLFFF